MGAAAAIPTPGSIPDEIQALYDLTERQKSKIIEVDSTMLDTEMGKMFKGHNKIIDELCARSKSQLKALSEKYPTFTKHLDNLNSSGNQYGKFIQQCGVPKADFDMECIRASGDYDEELLITIIGTSSIKELKKLNELYSKEYTFGLSDLCSTKNKSDASFIKFIQRIFHFDRSESKDINYPEAERLLELIHKAGAARLLGVDDDTIIEILATTSRVQCMAINELYQKRHKMKLERALNMKFKGNFSKLLILWTMPLPSAIVSCAGFLMQKIIPDKSAIMRFFARFDKDILKLADTACREMHQKPLSEYVGSVISGNQHRALKVWIEEASPDKGFQKIIDIYIETKFEEGYSLEEIYSDAELLAKLQFLLEKLAGELKLFFIEHKLKIDPADMAIMNNSQASVQGLAKTVSDIKLKQQSMRLLSDLALSPGDQEEISSHIPGKTPKTPKQVPLDFDIPECAGEEEEAEMATKEMMAHRKFSIVLPDSIQRNVHEQLVNHAYAYLISVFEDADEDAEGNLEASAFWATLKKLPLQTFGFVPRDIELIQKSSSWEMDDGRIYYYEALLEFSDSLVTAIENKDVDDDDENDPDGRDVIKIIDRLTKEKENREMNEDRLGRDITFGMDRAIFASKSSSRRTLSIRFGNIPVYFRQYVFDTVAAFDLDCSGYLKQGDLEKLLETLQIPSNILSVQQFIDNYANSMSSKGNPNMFDMKFCSETIFGAINGWFGDGQEHYICLIDKNNGAYFWFNTFDQSSQWVDSNTTGEISTQFKDFALDSGVQVSVPVSAREGITEPMEMNKSSEKKIDRNTPAEVKEFKEDMQDSKETSKKERKDEKDTPSDLHESSPKSSKSLKKENQLKEKSDDKLSAESDAKEVLSDDVIAETSSKTLHKEEDKEKEEDTKPTLNHAHTCPNDIVPVNDENIVNEIGGEESPHEPQDDVKGLKMSQSAPALVLASAPLSEESDQ